MGSHVGEIKYGIKITSIDAEILTKKFNESYFSHIEFNDDPIEAYGAYETDDFMLVVKESPEYSAYDCIKLLKDDFAKVNESWKENIIQFCEKHGIECDTSKIGWHLIGRYD